MYGPLNEPVVCYFHLKRSSFVRPFCEKDKYFPFSGKNDVTKIKYFSLGRRELFQSTPVRTRAPLDLSLSPVAQIVLAKKYVIVIVLTVLSVYHYCLQ